MNRIPIDTPSDPRIADYADQKDAWLRVQAAADVGQPTTGLPQGLFMAEGLLVVEQVIRSKHEVRSILGTSHRLDALKDRLGSIPDEIPVFVADQEVMDQIAGFPIHRGLLACARATEQPALHDLLADATTLVILEDLANHDNVGGIFRNVAALGGPRAAVLLSPRCCDPLYRKAIRVSMGHALHVPFARATDWPGELGQVSEAGFTTIALTPDPGAEPLSPVSGPVALLLGAEGPGLSPDTLARADVIARIPMAPGVDSLNVSVTSALALDRLSR